MTRMDRTRSGMCFKALLGIQFGPGALPTLRPRMASWTSGVSVNLGSLAGANEYARITSSTTSMTAGTGGSFTGWNWASGLSARASAFSEPERAIPSMWHWEAGEWELSSPVWLSSTVNSPPEQGFPARSSRGRSSSRAGGHWQLWVMDLGFQSGVPSGLPLTPSGVFHPEYEPLSGPVSHHAGCTWEWTLPTPAK